MERAPGRAAGLREVARRGLRYDLLVKPREWKYILQVAEAVPDLPLVIDHIAKPNIAAGQFDDWAAAMQVAASIPRMHIKLSGMVTEADPANWKPSDLQPLRGEGGGALRRRAGHVWQRLAGLSAGGPSYEEVFSALQTCLAGLSEAEKALVLGENARRFYGLAAPVV